MLLVANTKKMEEVVKESMRSKIDVKWAELRYRNEDERFHDRDDD